MGSVAKPKRTKTSSLKSPKKALWQEVEYKKLEMAKADEEEPELHKNKEEKKL